MSEALAEVFFKDGGGIDLRNFDLRNLYLIRSHVAQHMSCVVDGEMKKFNEGDVELLVWLHCTDRRKPRESTAGMHANIYAGDESGIIIRKSTADLYLDGESDIIMKIAAYAHPDRVHGMPRRLKEIATMMKRLFGDDLAISLKFDPIHPGCWYSA